MTQSLPVDTASLTPAWFSHALSARHPGVRVSAVEMLEEHGSTNHHARVRLTYDEQAGAPDTVFCKMASLDAAHRIAIGATGMGAREAAFYANLAPSVEMRIPTSHFAAADTDGAFLLLLEDLKVRGCAISDGTWGIPPGLASGALSDLARLHVRFEDADQLDAVRPWASTKMPGATEFTVHMLRHVIDTNSDVLSDAYIAVAEMYIADPDAVVALWETGPQTLIHGDAHIGNLFIDDGRVGFLDWGLITIASPMRDVSYFMTMGMTTQDRRGSEHQLLRHYLDARNALGGSPITFDEAWHAHRVHAAYTVLASFLSLVPPYNAEDQRVFADAFRNRAIACLDDLETVSALRALLA